MSTICKLFTTLPKTNTDLIMVNAIPIGKKISVFPLAIATRIKIIPLIAKSILAILLDFEFSDGLLLTLKAPAPY